MAGLDPSAVIGGKLRTIGGYGRSGATQRFVYEACEFKDTFLSTHPDIALVLNIDNDHMEYFHTVENAMKSYTRFAQKAHTVLYNGSDEKTCRAIDVYKRQLQQGVAHAGGHGKAEGGRIAGIEAQDGGSLDVYKRQP